MNKKEKADKALHLKDATKLLADLPTMPRNISGGLHPWEDIIEYRIQCVEEFIEYLKTGKTDHIRIQRDLPTEDIEHFK